MEGSGVEISLSKQRLFYSESAVGKKGGREGLQGGRIWVGAIQRELQDGQPSSRQTNAAAQPGNKHKAAARSNKSKEDFSVGAGMNFTFELYRLAIFP